MDARRVGACEFGGRGVDHGAAYSRWFVTRIGHAEQFVDLDADFAPDPGQPDHEFRNIAGVGVAIVAAGADLPDACVVSEIPLTD